MATAPFSNDQITSYVNSTLGGGGNWNDVLAAAQQYGVGADQLAGAYGMTADQGAQALQAQGVDTSDYYAPIENFQNVTNSGVGGLDAGGVTQMRDYVNQQLAGGFNNGKFERGDFFDTGSFSWDKGSATSQDEVFNRLAAAGDAMNLTDADLAKVLGGDYSTEMVSNWRNSTHNAPLIQSYEGAFKKDQGHYGDENAPNYATTYDPGQTQRGVASLGPQRSPQKDATSTATTPASQTSTRAPWTISGPDPVPDWMYDLKDAGNLTPEQLAILNSNQTGNYGTVDSNGFTYSPLVSWGQGEDGAGQNTILGYMGTPPGYDVAGEHEWYGMYDPSGNWIGPMNGAANGLSQEFITAALMMAAPIAWTVAGAGAGAAGGAAGVGEAGWGMGLDSMGGVGGGSGALEAMGGAGVTDLGAANGMWDVLPEAVGENVVPGTFNPAVDSQLANVELGLEPYSPVTPPAQYLPGSDPTVFNPAVDSQTANEALNLPPVSDPTPPAVPVNGPTGVPPGSPTSPASPTSPTSPATPTESGLPKWLTDMGITDWAKLAALLGLAGAGGGGGGGGGYAGYEGGIPAYGATRTQYGFDQTRTPGSAPQRYFGDVQYVPGGVSQLIQAPAPGGGATPAPASTTQGPQSAAPGADVGHKERKPKKKKKKAEYAAGGGVAALDAGASGRLLRGPGDGLSDDITASIDGEEPAALATGEYVLSADAVSALGGGSTEAGARRLDEMMDRIRQQAFGTKKQIRPVPDRALAA